MKEYLLFAALLVVAPAETATELPIKCGAVTCTMPKELLWDLLGQHSALVNEIRRMQFNCQEKIT